MRLVLLLAVLASWTWATLEAFGVYGDATPRRVLAWVALGLVFYALSLSPLPRPPRRRR